MKKKIISLTVISMTLFSNMVQAATPSYGPFPYSKSITHNFEGDLSPSGIGKTNRSSYVLWHDVRYKNIVTGQYKPSSVHIPTVQFDLIEQAGDNFGAKRGYHVVNLEENKAAIKKIVEDAGGNFDFVSRMLDQGTHPFLKNKYYIVDTKLPYVSFGSIVALCGGGNPTEDDSNVGHGVDKPVFQTTYQITPWPFIFSVAPSGVVTNPDGSLNVTTAKLNLNAKTYSVYNNTLTAYVVKGKYTKDQILANMSILSDAAQSKRMINGQTTGAANGALPISNFSNLIDGSTTDFTLVIRDSYDRIAAKNFSLTAAPVLENLKIVDLTVNPNPLEQEKQGVATVTVKNESAQLVTSPLTFQMDGTVISTQSVTLAPGEQKIFTFTFMPPDKNSVVLKATINPGQDQPENEVTYSDNSKEISVPIVIKKIEVPNTDLPDDEELKANENNLKPEIPIGQWNLRWEKKTPVDVIVKSGGFYRRLGEGTVIEYPVEFNNKITVSYPGYSNTFTQKMTTMKPGKLIHFEVPTPDYKAFSTKYGLPIPESAFLDIQVTVEVDCDSNLIEEESNRQDNVVTGTVRVYWSKTKVLQETKK